MTGDRWSAIVASAAEGRALPPSRDTEVAAICTSSDPLVAAAIASAANYYTEGTATALSELRVSRDRLSAVLAAVRGLVGTYYDADGRWNHEECVRTTETDALRDALAAADGAR